jgi:hypothetical protein
MKTIRKIIILFAVLAASCVGYSQPPGEFTNPKVDFYWIAFDYSGARQFGDTLEGMNGSWPVDNPGEDGKWSSYVDDITFLPWFNTWFYNGPLRLDHMKKIRMGFWVAKLAPGAPSIIDWVVNWSSATWPEGSGYPKPGDEAFVVRSPWNHLMIPPGQAGDPPTWVELFYQIPYFNPEWLSVDVVGANIKIPEDPMPPPATSPELLYWWNLVQTQTGTPPPGGIVVHECLPQQGGAGYDFGDAPEGDTAYIDPVVIGNFPTCMQVGPPNSFIKHGCPNPLFFGGTIDCELDGNAGLCPTFGPNHYNMDECGTIPYPFPPNQPPYPVDEGLFLPAPNTLGLLQPAFYGYFTCGGGGKQAMDTICHLAQWGKDLDIWIDASQAVGGFMNILFDWNRDGDWKDVVQCQGSPVSEHALINFPVPAGYVGPASAMVPPPPPIQVGPTGGYIWARFTLTEQPVHLPWDGSGAFADGETEDYLLYIAPVPGVIPLANWSLILAIGLIILFTFFIWWRRKG